MADPLSLAHRHGSSYKCIVGITCMLGTFMEVLDTSVANVALPHMKGTYAASTDEITWVLTSYLVANAIVLPITGWLGNTFGRKRLYLTCLALFTLASLAAGAAPTLGLLTINGLVAADGVIEEMEAELLRAFAELPGLKPDEVMIAVTDFDAYAPLAEGILRAGPQPLPVRLTAVPTREANPIAVGLLALLRLSLGRHCASELVELLNLAAVQHHGLGDAPAGDAVAVGRGHHVDKAVWPVAGVDGNIGPARTGRQVHARVPEADQGLAVGPDLEIA